MSVFKKIKIWIRKQDLFKLTLAGSIFVHVLAVSLYLASRYITFVDSDDIVYENVEIDFQDIPPELIGGSSSPAPVEKQEWVEGKKKDGKDPIDDDINLDKISGNGTDKDGFLFSFNGDKPPTPIIDFDLKQFFPEAAKTANISNKVVVMVVQVDHQGKLVSARIVSGKAGYGFDEAAMKIIHMIRFSPGYISGRPVKMSHRMPIYFSLEN